MNRRSVLGSIAAGLASFFAFRVGAAPTTASETIIIHGKTFELAQPIRFDDAKIIIEIKVGVLGKPHTFTDFMTINPDLLAWRLSECRRISVRSTKLTARGIDQIVFVSKSLIYWISGPAESGGEEITLGADCLVRLEGMLPSAVDALCSMPPASERPT